MRKKYLIPATLQTKVCMCDEPGSPLFDSKRRHTYMNCCNKCLKPFRWYVRRCIGCNTWFIKDFRIKEIDCAKHTLCWDCTMGDTEPCDCPKEQTIRPNFEPLGYNPKQYSADEVANVFDTLPF